jgi:hypothetical protein
LSFAVDGGVERGEAAVIEILVLDRDFLFTAGVAQINPAALCNSLVVLM